MVQQFDIIENADPRTRSRYPFLVILQHNRISLAKTAIVAPPTAPNSGLPSSRLHPSILVADRSYVLVTEELAAVQRRLLGRIVGSAASQRYEIIAAIDVCFTGI
jgi:toxin CcdB